MWKVKWESIIYLRSPRKKDNEYTSIIWKMWKTVLLVTNSVVGCADLSASLTAGKYSIPKYESINITLQMSPPTHGVIKNPYIPHTIRDHRYLRFHLTLKLYICFFSFSKYFLRMIAFDSHFNLPQWNRIN